MTVIVTNETIRELTKPQSVEGQVLVFRSMKLVTSGQFGSHQDR
jgi:hypothetical protein